MENGYKDVKTPEQLLKYMYENIKYGFVDDNGKEYGPWDNQEFQESCQTKWHLLINPYMVVQ